MIKPLELKDKEEVIELLQQPKEEIGEYDGMRVEPKYYTNWENIIKNGWSYKWVDNKDKMQGFIIATYDEVQVTIYDIEVKKDKWRQGIGSKLLNQVKTEAMNKQHPVLLITETYNYIAQGFYIKNHCKELRALNIVRY